MSEHRYSPRYQQGESIPMNPHYHHFIHIPNMNVNSDLENSRGMSSFMNQCKFSYIQLNLSTCIRHIFLQASMPMSNLWESCMRQVFSRWFRNGSWRSGLSRDSNGRQAQRYDEESQQASTSILKYIFSYHNSQWLLVDQFQEGSRQVCSRHPGCYYQSME